MLVYLQELQDLQDDLKRIARGQLIVATPSAYDRVQRGWRKRKVLQNINLMVFDDLHFVGVSSGAFCGSVYEVVVSRQKLIISALDIPTRIIGLSLSISNGKDIADPSEINFDASALSINNLRI